MNKSQVVMADKRSRQRGFTLLASAACAVALFGMAGLAIDLGRMYITKNEAQSFADSASLYAAMQLDGTAAGLTAADNAVATNPNKWNFATSNFTNTIVEYSSDGSTGWTTSASVANPSTISYVRVTPVVNNVALFFLPVIGTGTSATVKAFAVGGQVVAGTSGSNPIRGGLFPYSPIANVDGTTPAQVLAADPTGNFGFTPGQQYDLKWPSSPQLGTVGDNKVPCAGDDNTAMINRKGSNASEFGEIQLEAASSISAQIRDDTSGLNVVIGQNVVPTNGNKNVEVDAMNARIAQDGDTTSTTYASYDANYAHNGRRLITVIVNNGNANAAGVDYPAGQQTVGVGYAQFLLLPSYDKNGGSNNPWCAVYVGPNPTYGTRHTGVGTTEGQGVAFIRLTQ